ncbi:DNA repair protein RecN [Flavobacteriaceae bacterium]|nr:DNA repair protein RecN [Flavobacteriaceae bacterium]
MLTQLKIKNFALIEDLEVDFSEGMTSITGETGAGKSILLGGLSLVLGKRADLSSLFDSTRKCIVEATFQIKSYALQSLFAEYDLDYEDETVLRRELLPQGKSRAFVNDTPVNLNVLEEISLHLIDIHSQHDAQTLLENQYQFQVLDALAGNQNTLGTYQTILSAYRNTQKEYKQCLENQAAFKEEFELKQFLLDELQASKLEVGREDEIKTQLHTLTHIEFLQTTFAAAIQLLENESLGIVDQLKELRRYSQGLSEKSKQYESLRERVQGVAIEMEDVMEEFKHQFEFLESNPQKLEELQAQMDHLNVLYQKHRVQSESELIAIQSELEQTLKETLNLDDRLDFLVQKQKEQEAELKHLSDQLSQNRHKAITVLEGELKNLVTKMGMQDAVFKIELTSSIHFLNNGTDVLTFQFSANKGSDFKDLKKVASGGELSRIMLAIKTILSQYKNLPTLVFDEIDTGVSGKISDSIAEVMATIAKKLQVIAITHLPQVAAKAKYHFLVEKIVQDGKTKTQLYSLDHEARVEEIAKMLSGNQVTETAIAHAKQLMN